LREAGDVNTERDPFPYHGPLRRADGVAPFNHYLWPLEGDWFWASRELDRHYSSLWNFCAVALNDGTWLAHGFVWEKAYPTRIAALRASAAAMLRSARNARHWKGMDAVSNEQFEQLVKWVYEILDRPPPPIKRVDVTPAAAAWADLPLFAETP
jgi:hypothetical protein